ncbi:GK.2 family protein [Megaselia abdita]
MEKYGKFGPLLGVIQVSKIYAKFLVYAARNAEILTYHEITLKQIVPNASWLEYDPQEIVKSVKECIEIACQNLIILEINPVDIVAVGLTTQRGTTVLWDRVSGEPLYNAISWSDARSTDVLKGFLGKVKGNLNYLKSVCGLPLSTCFSALKIKWLEENVPLVQQSVANKNCCFGTLDSWILWNLTGSTDNGSHVTDVTNAGYTMLMNLHTQQWDRNLCSFFNLPKIILPEIRSNSEVYGYIQQGPLRGIPISSSIGDQPAALLGQLCTNVGQSLCTIDESCFVLLNTGEEIIDSESGLCSVAAFKLGEKGKCVYAVEGAISNAGASITWLKDTLQINTEINQNENTAEVLSTFLGDNSMISSACSSMGNLIGNGIDGNGGKKGELIFVPAFNGLYSPYWKYDARGLLLGLTSNTTSEHVTQAAYEATGFQIKEILTSLHVDSPVWAPTKKLTIGGDYAENNHFMQFISDIVGISIGEFLF